MAKGAHLAKQFDQVRIAEVATGHAGGRVMSGSFVWTFSDPQQFQDSMRPAEIEIFVTGRGRYDATLTKIQLGSLWMQRGHFALPAVAHSKIPNNRRMFFLQFDPNQAPILNSGIEVTPSDIVCYPLGSEHHYRTSASYSCGGMSLAEEDFAAYEKAFLGHAQAAHSTMRVVRPRPALLSRVLSVHKAATDLAATAPDILAHPEVAKAITHELARAMIACITDPVTEERYRPRQHRLSVMARFEQMLQAQSDEPLYVADICSGIGVSERTLRAHCQDQLGMNPHRYLWLRRMNLASRSLAHADPAAKTVTEIANDHGFAELGRFAVSYRKLFGESPSVTLRRASDDRSSVQGRAF
jgi:AraC-like DNA-binding protein